MKKWPLVAGVLALLALCLATPVASAQPGGTRPTGASEPVGVSFNLKLIESQMGGAPAEALTLTGRFNISGEFELQFSLPQENEEVSLVFVGDRFYVNLGEGWQYIESDELLGAAAGLGTGDTSSQAPPEEPDPCDNIAEKLPQNFFSELGNLNRFGMVGAPTRTTVNGVAVQEYRGTLNIVAIVQFFGSLLSADPECAASLGEFDTVLEDLGQDMTGLPAISFVLDLGEEDQFPYHVELTISDDEETLQIIADLTPSATPFAIQAPPNATPFSLPTGGVPTLPLGPGPVIPPSPSPTSSP